MENDGCGRETVPHPRTTEAMREEREEGKSEADEHVRSLPREHCPMDARAPLLCIAFVLLRFQREHDGNPVRIVKLVHAVEFANE